MGGFHAASWNQQCDPAALWRSIDTSDEAPTPTFQPHSSFLTFESAERNREDASMIPPFAFSGGGLIAVLDSIKKIGSALHNQDGASAECQRLVQNLHALQLIFQCLEALENNGVNQSYMDAVQAEADKSLKLLSELLQNVARSEKRLKSTAPVGTNPGNPEKLQLPTTTLEELSKLQSDINLEIAKMNLSTATGIEQLM